MENLNFNLKIWIRMGKFKFESKNLNLNERIWMSSKEFEKLK